MGRLPEGSRRQTEPAWCWSSPICWLPLPSGRHDAHCRQGPRQPVSPRRMLAPVGFDGRSRRRRYERPSQRMLQNDAGENCWQTALKPRQCLGIALQPEGGGHPNSLSRPWARQFRGKVLSNCSELLSDPKRAAVARIERCAASRKCGKALPRPSLSRVARFALRPGYVERFRAGKQLPGLWRPRRHTLQIRARWRLKQRSAPPSRACRARTRNGHRPRSGPSAPRSQ